MSFESHNIYFNSRFMYLIGFRKYICGGNAMDGKVLSDIL